MKSTLAGLVAAIIVGAIGLIVLRSTGVFKLPGRNASPSPSASVSPNFQLADIGSPSPSGYVNGSGSSTASPSPSSTPSSTGSTTKGGLVLGDDNATPVPTVTPKKVTTTTTTTTTTSVKIIRLFETKSCPVDGTVYLRGIESNLNIKYSLKDGYSARVTIWKESGESVLNQTKISGSGVLTTISSRDNLKFQVVSDSCSSTDDTWLKLTAEK